MTTLAKRNLLLDDRAVPADVAAGADRGHGWLLLVALVVALGLALGIASAAAHPDLEAGAPEMPIEGWGD